MFYRGKFAEGADGREMGAKRQRLIDQGPSFYGTPPSSSFMYNPPPAYGYVIQPPPFPVVRLRGLPFDCTEVDVAEFFHGLDIVDVLFVHKNNKFTGEAFCVLGYPLQVDFALQRNRQNMGRRYVEVFRSKRQEYYKAIANEVSDARGGSPHRSIPRAKSHDEGKDSAVHTGILRLRGLPFSAGKDDIMDFFKDFVLSEDSIHITMNSDGRPTGEAFVEFANAEDSKAAMAKDRMTLGSRYIELFPSSHEEMDEALSRGRMIRTRRATTKSTTRAEAAAKATKPRRAQYKRQLKQNQKQKQHVQQVKQPKINNVEDLLPSTSSTTTATNLLLLDHDDDTSSSSSSGSGCSTPKAPRFRIPEIVTCPPAPKKQRVVSNCSSLQRNPSSRPIAFFAPPDLELFFFFALRDISV